MRLWAFRELALLVPCFEVCSLLSPDESEIDVERTLELLPIFSTLCHLSLYNVVYI